VCGVDVVFTVGRHRLEAIGGWGTLCNWAGDGMEILTYLLFSWTSCVTDCLTDWGREIVFSCLGCGCSDGRRSPLEV
jgi:hypothetical protein